MMENGTWYTIRDVKFVSTVFAHLMGPKTGGLNLIRRVGI